MTTPILSPHCAWLWEPHWSMSYAVNRSASDILLYEIELGSRASFDLFHHDDILINGLF